MNIGYGYFRGNHSKDERARVRVKINGSEGFWGFAKLRLLGFAAHIQ
jgi:hypothetical protein